jgi:hypothetical protein
MRGDIWGQQALQAQGRALYGSLLPLPSADRTNARTRCRKGALSYVRHNVMALRTGLPPNLRSYNTCWPAKALLWAA